ncbi:hypothetical protein [Pontibacter sp. G13]|uniref:hypothetical protein n=1 Tax=Pontibacter sp. G13 TaxID=3074898 RepID=UPI00288B06B1|nr:hypothetical protein [Pontibacter sp. G13]WNJ16467.1 hypothetical protein RJD25_16500 [Pontibacter sp. G13]
MKKAEGRSPEMKRRSKTDPRIKRRPKADNPYQESEGYSKSQERIKCWPKAKPQKKFRIPRAIKLPRFGYQMPDPANFPRAAKNAKGLCGAEILCGDKEEKSSLARQMRLFLTQYPRKRSSHPSL